MRRMSRKIDLFHVNTFVSLFKVPSMTNYSMTNHTYRYYDGDPRFPFGYGLSYSIYNYHDLVLNPTRVKAGNNVNVKFAINNQGPYGGLEVKYYIMQLQNSYMYFSEVAV